MSILSEHCDECQRGYDIAIENLERLVQLEKKEKLELRLSTGEPKNLPPYMGKIATITIGLGLPEVDRRHLRVKCVGRIPETGEYLFWDFDGVWRRGEVIHYKHLEHIKWESE